MVGRSCILPGALHPDDFWDNILGRRVSLSRVPEGRWRLPVELAVTPATGDPTDCADRTWSDIGGYVQGFDEAFEQGLDPGGALTDALGQADPSAATLDPLFGWTVHGAAAALRESGQQSRRHRAGLVLGNLSFPSTGLAAYAEQVWLESQDAALRDRLGIVLGRRPHAFNRFMSGLPAILAARALELGLGGFAIDAACASALYAVKLACDRLHDRRADVMLAGGVSRADDLFIHVSFCSLAAMSRTGRSRPFHRDADGLVPAEGAAFVALMRLDDAIAADAPIFGVIRGVGLSNDGRSHGLLAPSEDGQARAIRAAYAAAGVSPNSVGLLECHATGTRIGDAAEVRSTSRVFATTAGLTTAGLPVGSVKSNVGHLITAAGAAGLLKVLGALRAGIRPATLGVDEPLAELSGSPLRLLTEAEDWPGQRRGAVSAFGFGGNNAHLIVDAWTGDDMGTPAVIQPARPAMSAGSTETGPTETGPTETGSTEAGSTEAASVAPVAIVAIGAMVADGRDTHDLCRTLMAGTGRATRRATVEVGLDGLCFPPVDLAQAQPQQVLILAAARDAAAGVRLPTDRTMVLIGMGTDPEVARYVARWRVPAWLAPDTVTTDPGLVDTIRDAVRPAQTAAGVLGAMPNIVANRINTQLGLTGPGFTVSAEEASGLVALELATRALRAGDADAVLVGAVDLAHEAVHQAALTDLAIPHPPGDAAVVLVLKRLADARADNDEIIAVLDDGSGEAASAEPGLTVGDAGSTTSTHEQSTHEQSTREQLDPSRLFGRAHAASGLLSVAIAALALRHRATPRAGLPAVPTLHPQPAEAAVEPLAGPAVRVRLHPGGTAAFLAEAPRLLRVYSGGSRAEVRAALAAGRESADGPARLVVLSAEGEEHAARTQAAGRWLEAGGSRPEGVVFRERPVAGDVVFVFSGGSMAYPGMGRELMLAFPTVADAVATRCGPLRHLIGWAYARDARPRHALDQIWGASVLGQLHTGITRTLLGIRPQASIGYSSGELTALAALGAWPDVTPLSAQAADPDLFAREIAGDLEVVRRAWRRLGIPETGWASYLIDGPVDRVRAALAGEPAVHLMVVNTRDSCVIGGEAGGCERVRRRLDDLHALPIPYEIPAHVPELADVRADWLRTYHLPTAAVTDVRFYTCSTGMWFHPTADGAAEAVTRQQLGPIDFANTVERAWADGGRIFIEHGPRTLCSSWIRHTLGAREHLTVSLDGPDGRDVNALLRAVAELVAAGVPADTTALARHLADSWPTRVPTGRALVLPAHPPQVRLPDTQLPDPRHPEVPPGEVMAPAPVLALAPVQVPAPALAPAAVLAPVLAPAAVPAAVPVEAVGLASGPGQPLAMIVADQYRLLGDAHRHSLAVRAQAHEEFLAARQRAVTLLMARRDGIAVPPDIQPTPAPTPAPTPTPTPAPAPGTRREPSGPAMRRADLEQFVSGPVAPLLGSMFADLDALRRRIRLPGPPLLLADRVLGIDAEPGSLGIGTIWTETEVLADSWYLDPCGRMPAGIMAESGQASLLLLSWLGADRLARGERVYRLLGCEVTFHGALPQPGETLRYEVHIDGQESFGDIPLFSFHCDCFAGDELRLSIAAGQAGLFTDAELAGGRGLPWDPADHVPPPGGVLDPPALVRGRCAFGPDEVRAFAEGRPADCFGPGWESTRAHVRTPRIADGDGRFLDEVTVFDPGGGPWGRGYLQATMRVSPQAWFFAAHFPHDPCMPGTLMAEGCFQAMSFYLAACGYTVEHDGWRFEPVSGIAYPIHYRGQVQPRNNVMIYEVFVIELIAGPEPTLVADVLCTVDGIRACHGSGLRLRLVPDWPLTHWRLSGPPAQQPTDAGVALPALAGLVGHGETVSVARAGAFAFDYPAMLGCAWGKPSEAFGPPYVRFDNHRHLARLPGPPFHFMSRVTATDGPPWVLATGTGVVVEYDVPGEVWYFEQNDSPVMPLAVLMEVVLQASGWLAAYVGSALDSETDLHFRNLDGTATFHREIGPDTNVLATRTRLADVAHDGAMIIETFEVECFADGEPACTLQTVFGFFPRSAFDDQVGIPPSDTERELLVASSSFAVDLTARPQEYFGGALRLPGPMLLMLDRVTGYWPDGGPGGLGRLRAEKDVDPGEWFFRAHFFQDPVQPGSLGVQAICQLVQFYAIERGLAAGMTRPRFAPVRADRPVTWKYRGQVTPHNQKIIIEVEILDVGADDTGPYVLADGWLWVDGIRIYQIQRLGVGIVAADG